MRFSELDVSRLLTAPLWSHLAQRPALIYIPAIALRQNLAQRTPITLGSDASLDFDAEQGAHLSSDGTGAGQDFAQPFQLGTGHDFTYMQVYRFTSLPTDAFLLNTEITNNRSLAFLQQRAGANGGTFEWVKSGVVAISTGLPTIFRGMWHAIAITYRHATGDWIAVHRSLGADPNDFQQSHQTSVATGTNTANFLSNTSGSWRLGASRTGGADLIGDIAFTYFGLNAVPEALLRAWVEDWRAPFRPVQMAYRAAVAPAGRIMSSLADAGGLAGRGGIAGQGGGLAG